MGHLSPEEFIDIADGAPEPPHVASCEACRRQLADVRSLMGTVAGVDVPEPSPLFWDHLSARVNEAVVAEPQTAPWFKSWRVAVPIAVLATAAALIVAVVVARQPTAPPHEAAIASSAAAEAREPRALLSDGSGDPGFAFVADLAEGADVDTETLTTLGASPADHAVDHLSEEELHALAALLKADMPPEHAS